MTTVGGDQLYTVTSAAGIRDNINGMVVIKNPATGVVIRNTVSGGAVIGDTGDRM